MGQANFFSFLNFLNYFCIFIPEKNEYADFDLFCFLGFDEIISSLEMTSTLYCFLVLSHPGWSLSICFSTFCFVDKTFWQILHFHFDFILCYFWKEKEIFFSTFISPKLFHKNVQNRRKYWIGIVSSIVLYWKILKFHHLIEMFF